MKEMKEIDKSFKSQQEIFAWLGSGGKVAYKASGNIISFIDGKLVSETSNVEVTRNFNVSKDWEKVLPPSWEDFLEEYDILCFVDDNGSPNINRSPCYLVVDREEKAFKDAYQLFWNCATPLDINDFIILDNKYIARRKPCSTE